MFEKIREKMDALMEGPKEFNPSSIDDPMAADIDWNPLKKGGTSFKTHKVKTISSSRLEIAPTTMSKVFPAFFGLFGLMAVGFSSGFDLSNLGFNWLPSAMGLLFVGVAVYLYLRLNKRKIIDKGEGFYWEGKKEPRDVFDVSPEKGFVELNNVYAIQLIKERVKSDKSHYSSYELNFVLKDKTRFNVMDHGSLTSIREDAKSISAFLEVPVWDGIPG